jgi:cytochrome b pre-mRNA-processing protein 3
MKVQIMYNYLFDYIDYSLREIGTGDLSVGKKVKTMARIFSFRIKLYEKSISKDFKNIKKPIKKFIYENKVRKNNLDNFYNYINKQHKKLNSSNSKRIFSKNFFKEPF